MIRTTTVSCSSALARCGALAILLLGLATAATADEVWLTNGKVLEGKARQLEDGRVEVRLPIGTLVLPAERVDRIERSTTLEEFVREGLALLAADDAQGRYQLALWVEEQGSATLARQLLEEALAIDPNHPEARRELGFSLHEGRWVTGEELHALRGEVRLGDRWVSREELAIRLALAAEERRLRRLESTRAAELDAQLARLALAVEEREARQAERQQGLPFYDPYATAYPGALTGTVVVAPGAGIGGGFVPPTRDRERSAHRGARREAAPRHPPRNHRSGYVKH